MNSSRLGGAGRGLDLGVGGVGPAVGDVRPDRVGEQEATPRTPRRPGGAASRSVTSRTSMPSMVTAPVGHVVEAGEQQRDGRLARPAARRRGRRSRPAPTVREKPSSTGSRARVAEAHVVEAHVAGRRAAASIGVGSLDHQRVGVEQVEDALGAGPGLLADGDERGEHPHRRDELHQVRREGEERAEGDAAVDREPAAEAEHRHLAERRDRTAARRVAAPGGG